MNVHQPPLFVPPHPDIPNEEPGWYAFFRAARTNALTIWPRAAYEQAVVVGSMLGRQRFLLNAPKAGERAFRSSYHNERTCEKNGAGGSGIAPPAPNSS